MTNGKSRKLVGQHSTIFLKRNGSVEPLVISQPELVPDKLCVWQGVFTGYQFENVMRILGREWPRVVIEELRATFTRSPLNTLVREALIQPCERCDGTGEILVPTGVDVCPSCRGTRRASVPGAHLEPRGFHIEVK